MAQYNVWTPGYTAQPQFTGPGALLQVNNTPWSDLVGLRKGNGVKFRLPSGKSNWFHFAITTPTYLDGKRVKVTSVAVLYATDNAPLKSVQVWDGPYLINQTDGLAIIGDRSGYIDASFNVFNVNSDDISYGIGISVFMEAGLGLDATISFASAGVVFDI